MTLALPDELRVICRLAGVEPDDVEEMTVEYSCDMGTTMDFKMLHLAEHLHFEVTAEGYEMESDEDQEEGVG